MIGRTSQIGALWTFTIGGDIRGDERDRFADGIDEEEAGDLLQRDVRWAERGVLRLIDVPLTDGQFDALVSFTFNLGTGALQRSTLRRKVNREEHAEVPREFMRWVWAGVIQLKGLVRRRCAEADFYLSLSTASYDSSM